MVPGASCLCLLRISERTSQEARPSRPMSTYGLLSPPYACTTASSHTHGGRERARSQTPPHPYQQQLPGDPSHRVRLGHRCRASPPDPLPPVCPPRACRGPHLVAERRDGLPKLLGVGQVVVDQRLDLARPCSSRMDSPPLCTTVGAPSEGRRRHALPVLPRLTREGWVTPSTAATSASHTHPRPARTSRPPRLPSIVRPACGPPASRAGLAS